MLFVLCCKCSLVVEKFFPSYPFRSVKVCKCNSNPKFVLKIISNKINSYIQSPFNWLPNVN